MAIKSRLYKDTFYQIAQPAIVVIPSINIPSISLGCCSDYVLKVLADNTGEDLQNDKNGFLWWFNDTILDAVLSLQKYENGTWSSIALLESSTTYGTPSNYGFYINDALESFVGYQLEWALVLAEQGEGSYRVVCDTIDMVSNLVALYSNEFCLKTYSPTRANGTIRVEYYLNGTLGLNKDDKKVKDLGLLNWFNSMRLNGFFTYTESTYSEDRITYNTGERLFVSDEQEPEYRMQLKQQPEFVHDTFRTDIMMADDIYITDYNNRLPLNLVQKNVYKNSSYSPKWNYMKSKLASVEVKWKQKYNNYKKLRY